MPLQKPNKKELKERITAIKRFLRRLKRAQLKGVKMRQLRNRLGIRGHWSWRDLRVLHFPETIPFSYGIAFDGSERLLPCGRGSLEVNSRLEVEAYLSQHGYSIDW